MLALPLQRGENVDLAPAFYSFLQAQYGDEGVGAHAADVSAFQLARDSAVCVLDPSEIGIQHILRLNYHLNFIVPRLRGYEAELKFSFNWYDGFRNSRKVTTTSLSVDWACFMWNLGALDSQRGARIDRSTEEGIRNASKYFQQAAGIFDYIRKNMLKDLSGPVPSGLTEEGLHMAIQLMLAQAQLCFYEKAVKDKKAGSMKAGIVAKLGLQASVYYATVRDSCQGTVLTAVVDPSWAHHAEFQSKSFFAAAEYWQAQAAKEAAVQRGSGYGEEITRLTMAERAIRQGLDCAKTNRLSSALIAAGEGLMTTIISLKAKAIQENNTIYMESVPSETSMVPVVGVAMVRTSPVPEYQNPEKHFFSEILPKAIRLLRGAFRDEVNGIVIMATADVEAANQADRLALSSIGLPASLETYKSGAQLPENLVSKIGRLQHLGGKAELSLRYEELEGAARRALQSMSNIDETIAREERTDIQFRSRYPSWTGTPSSVLSQDIRANNSRMRDAFASARESDKAIEREMADTIFDQWVATLCAPVASITALLPVPPPDLLDFSGLGGSGAPSTAIDTRTLEQKLVEMARAIEARETAVATLKGIADLNIIDELLGCVSSGTDPAVVCEAYKRRCGEPLAVISSSLERQPILISEIIIANEAFQKAQATDPITTERDRIVRELDQNATRYFNLHAQLSAGITFYSNVQARLSTLQQSADDLCYSQQLLRREYEIQRQQEMDRVAQQQQQQAATQQFSQLNTQPAQLQQQSYQYPQTQSFAPQQPLQQQQQQPQQQQQHQQYGGGARPYPDLAGHQQQQPQPQSQGPYIPNTYGAAPVPSHAIPQQQHQQQTQQPYGAQGQYPQPAPQQQQQQQHQQQMYSAPPMPPQSAPQYPAQAQAQPHAQPGYAQNYGQPTPMAPQQQGGYQSYPAATSYQPQMQPQASASSAPSGAAPGAPSADMTEKAVRLSEMGFSLENCMSALSVSGGDEITALNVLLQQGDATSGAAAPATAAPAAAPDTAAAAPPAKPSKPSGLFGKVWGRS